MLKNKYGKLINLQMFAAYTGAGEGGEPPVEPTPTNPPADQIPPVDDGLPKTKEELEKLLASEADRRVTGALKTAQAKWETEYAAKMEAEKKESERLAKLSADEKARELQKKQQEELTKKEQELALREMKLESVKILNEKGLPIEFVDLLTTADADSTKANIDNFDKAFKAALEKSVNERLKSSGGKPPVGTTVDLTAKLEEARKKAQVTGKHEDRVAYAQLKHEIELSKK
jgi:hypothetical protein